jgi:hypothetical protein
MSEYVKVEGHTSLVRDENSTAIVSTDIQAWRLQKRRKEMFLSQRNEINSLRDEVQDVKFLLKEILEKINA